MRGAGAGVGEIALLTRGPRTATVRAVDAVRAYRLSIEAFEQIIGREAAVADYLLEEARSNLQKTSFSAGSPLISLPTRPPFRSLCANEPSCGFCRHRGLQAGRKRRHLLCYSIRKDGGAG